MTGESRLGLILTILFVQFRLNDTTHFHQKSLLSLLCTASQRTWRSGSIFSWHYEKIIFILIPSSTGESRHWQSITKKWCPFWPEGLSPYCLDLKPLLNSNFLVNILNVSLITSCCSHKLGYYERDPFQSGLCLVLISEIRVWIPSSILLVSLPISVLW